MQFISAYDAMLWPGLASIKQQTLNPLQADDEELLKETK
jgi:hypothetical protein